MRCRDKPPECLVDHVSRSLDNAGPGKDDGQIRADCPVCGSAGALTVTVGDVVRFVWTCHAHDCDRGLIRKAMLARKVRESCLPPERPARQRGKRRRSDAEIVAELRTLLDRPVNGNAFRLQAAMLLLDLDAKAAAERLGIPERTRRRLLAP